MECRPTLADKSKEGTLPIGIIEEMIRADLIRPVS